MGDYFVKKKTNKNKNTKLNETMRVEQEAYLMHEALKCLTGEFTHPQFLQECLPTSKTQGSVPFFSKTKRQALSRLFLAKCAVFKAIGILGDLKVKFL